MELKGTVTSIDIKLLNFTINSKIIVHMGILISQKPHKNLPELNSEIKLEKYHYFPNKNNIQHVMLCLCSKITGIFNIAYDKDNKMLELIKKHNLGVTDLIEMFQNMSVINENYPLLLETYKSEVIIKIIENIISARQNDASIQEKQCLNKVIPSFNLITINNCKYIDLKSDKYNYKSWIHGVHHKHKFNDYLLGYVSLNKKYGLFQIKDAKYRMFLTFVNKDINNLEDIIGNFLIIKDYVIFTEYYPNSTQNFDYILVDFKDVTMLDVEDNRKVSIFKEIPDNGLYKFSKTFTILRISTVQFDSKKQRSIFWLQIELENSKEDIFLCLPQNFIQLHPFLKENDWYTIHYNQILKSVSYNDITMIDSTIKQYELNDETAIFVKENSKNNEKTPLMNAFQCKNILESCTDSLVSFQGIVRAKFLEDSNSIRKFSKTARFGTPGSQVHNLKFFLDETNIKNTNELKIYFRDWENLLTPLCLVPFMRLAVRNVSSKKKYLKTTIFTKIDVISYEPPVPYTTVNLCYDGDYMPWGVPFYLGACTDVPVNVLIWGRVTNLTINIVKITNICTNCNHILYVPGDCLNCSKSNRKFEVFFSFLASDIEGQSKIVSRCIDFLKILLDLSDKQFDIWLKAFEEIGDFEFNRYEEKEYSSLDKVKESFYEALTDHFEVLNEYDTSSYGLLCLKKKNDPYVKIPKPSWLCLDVKTM